MLEWLMWPRPGERWWRVSALGGMHWSTSPSLRICFDDKCVDAVLFAQSDYFSSSQHSEGSRPRRPHTSLARDWGFVLTSSWKQYTWPCMVLLWLRIHHDPLKRFEVLEWFWGVAFLAHHLLKYNKVPKSRYLQVDSLLSWEFMPKKESQG